MPKAGASQITCNRKLNKVPTVTNGPTGSLKTNVNETTVHDEPQRGCSQSDMCETETVIRHCPAMDSSGNTGGTASTELTGAGTSHQCDGQSKAKHVSCRPGGRGANVGEAHSSGTIQSYPQMVPTLVVGAHPGKLRHSIDIGLIGTRRQDTFKDHGSNSQVCSFPIANNTLDLSEIEEDERNYAERINKQQTKQHPSRVIPDSNLLAAPDMVEYYQFMGIFNASLRISHSRSRSSMLRLPSNIRANTSKASQCSQTMEWSETSHYQLGTTLQEIRADTPETYIPDIPCFPDMGIYCRDCEIYVRIERIQDHRMYHRALREMRYKGASRPESLEELQKRRAVILKKMNKLTGVATNKETLDPHLVQRINHAYELLKADLEDTQEHERSVLVAEDYQLVGQSLHCSPECVLGVGMCSYDNSRWKSQMEDTKVFQDYFGNDAKKCFLGIYDGHHGKFAADIAAHELHHALLKEMMEFDRDTKCSCAFNMAEHNDITKYQISSHLLTAENSPSKRLVHTESVNDILQIMHKCGDEVYDADLITVDTNKIAEIEAIKKERKSPRAAKTLVGGQNEFAENMKLAFKKSYYKVDRLLSYGKHEHSRVRWSGCSGVTVCLVDKAETNADVMATVEECDDNGDDGRNNQETMIEEKEKDKEDDEKKIKQIGWLYVANAGDCQAVLVRANHAYRVSKDHSLKNLKEKARIEKLGGFASQSERQLRVNGLLTATRGLGNHGDPKLKSLISSEAQCTCVPIDQYAQFLIIASNGLWEIFSPEEAADLISQMLPSNQIPPPNVPSSCLGSFISRYNQHVQNAEATSLHSDQCLQSPIYEEGEDESPRNVSMTMDPGDKLSSLDGSDKVDNENLPLNASESVTRLPSALRSSSKGEENVQKDGRRLSFADDVQETKHCESFCETASQTSAHESGHEADVDTNTDFMSFRGPESPDNCLLTHADLQREFAQNMATRLVHAALIAGACNNITCMVVLFPGSEV